MGTPSQPAPDQGSPAGLREHGPVRELHLRGDRCHRRGGMRLHRHRADRQHWPPACWDSALGTRGCPSPLRGRAAKHQCPYPRAPSLQQDCAVPFLATHPVCAGHIGTPPATNMAPCCWGMRWDGPEGQVPAGRLQQSRQESSCPRSQGAATCGHGHKMPKLWSERGSSNPAAACPAALDVLWA